MKGISEPSRRSDFWLAAGIFLLTMIISWAFWSLLPAAYQENQSTDFTSFFDPVARNIIAGKGITLDGNLASRYPPGFPLFIARTYWTADVLGLSEEAALLGFRLLCAGLSSVLLYAIARLVWKPIPAVAVALAWSTYPFVLWLTKQPNSEVAFIPLMFGSVYMLWRALLHSPRSWWLYLGAGLLSGVAMLVRPAGIGLGLVSVVLVFLFAERSLGWLKIAGLAGLLLVGNVLAVAPWQFTAFAATGEFIPLSSDSTLTIKDGLTFLAIPKEYRRPVDVPEDVAAMMNVFQSRRRAMNELDGLVRVVMEEAGKDPVAFAKIIGIKSVRSWYGVDSRQFEGATLALQLVYLGLALWGSLYAWSRGTDLGRMMAGNWLIVGYFWAMTLLVVPLMRYLLPGMGLLMIAFPGVYYSLVGMRQRRARDSAAVLDTNA